VFNKRPDPATLPASTVFGTAFSSDGVYLSVGSNATPYIEIYKDTSDIEIYKSSSTSDIGYTYGAGYVKTNGVASDVVDMVRIFR